MNPKTEKRIYDLHTAFLTEYSQANNGLSAFYNAVSHSVHSILVCWSLFLEVFFLVGTIEGTIG